MKKYEIITTAGRTFFTGRYMPEMEKTNWHYYQSDTGQILHFRKEHMVYVIETDIKSDED